jgi:hypothetical protein
LWRSVSEQFGRIGLCGHRVFLWVLRWSVFLEAVAVLRMHGVRPSIISSSDVEFWVEIRWVCVPRN